MIKNKFLIHNQTLIHTLQYININIATLNNNIKISYKIMKIIIEVKELRKFITKGRNNFKHN